MNNRKVLHASNGMVLTNGIAYGRSIFLAESSKESDWCEITQDEADAMFEKSGGIDNGEY